MVNLQPAGAQRNITFTLPEGEKAFTLYIGGAMSKPIAQQQPRAWAQAPNISHGIPAISIFGNRLTVSTLNQNQLTLNEKHATFRQKFFPWQESAFLGEDNYAFPAMGGIR